jgi:hypothetical protein
MSQNEHFAMHEFVIANSANLRLPVRRLRTIVDCFDAM